jgi:predicted ATPase
VWLVELGPLSEEALVLQAVAWALGVRAQPGRPLTSTLVDASKSMEVLILLDNCEHLVDTCAQLVETLLLSCPHLRVLATSREALNMPEEITWLVPSLSLPDPRRQPTVGELEAYGPARLFVERTRRRGTGFAPSPQNAVADVCRRLDGMPLAIELAAARIGVLSVEQISEARELSQVADDVRPDRRASASDAARNSGLELRAARRDRAEIVRAALDLRRALDPLGCRSGRGRYGRV